MPWNNPDTRSDHNVATGSHAINKPEARVESPLCIHHTAGPCLPIGTKSAVDRQFCVARQLS